MQRYEKKSNSKAYTLYFIGNIYKKDAEITFSGLTQKDFVYNLYLCCKIYMIIDNDIEIGLGGELVIGLSTFRLWMKLSEFFVYYKSYQARQ